MSPGRRAPLRILVALDASRASLEALSAAAALAGRMGAELEGLFVEDVNLLRAAGLPFAAHIYSLTGSGPAAPVDMEEVMRALAARARQAMAQAAQPARVTWSFRVVRGQVSGEVLEAAGSVDLLVLGRTGRRMGRGAGTTARVVAARAPTSVLILARGGLLAGPMHVAYDGSPAADRALELAARLEGSHRAPILVVLAATREQAEGMAARAQERLGWAERPPWRWAGGAGREDLIRSVSDRHAALVVGVGSSFLGDVGLDRLLDEADCPVLLVR